MQNYTVNYQYDELGNILEQKNVGKWTKKYFYDFSANNYLLKHDEHGINTYLYDKHGNMTSMPHLEELKWDFKDNFKEATLDLAGNKAYYTYDSSGNRVRKVVKKGNIKEERIYLGDYEIFRKFVGSSIDTERETVHISDDNQKIAQIDGETIRYQLSDHLGSASLELDENAEIISYEEYYPFGTTSYRSGRTETEVSLKRYKYTGKERDNETGLYYYGARYYASWLGRFVSVDPLTEERSWLNPYNYVQNSPINRIDSTGMLDEPIVIGGKLVGYRVEKGQGPTQIAADINNPATQQKYGYTLDKNLIA